MWGSVVDVMLFIRDRERKYNQIISDKMNPCLSGLSFLVEKLLTQESGGDGFV